jgi:hypothetical protein
LGLGQESYRRLVTYALDELGYKIVRLSPDKMYSARKPMSGLFDRGLDEEAFTKELQSHYSQFDDLLANERWAGKLSTKLWDEPRPKDYADVVKSYSALRKAYPALLRELSEQPGEALSGAADIWVVYTKFLREQDVIEQHKQGKKMWLYANDLHGIDQPLGSMRNIGWLLWYYNLDGYHFWAINWWRKDPWSTASTREVDFLKRGTLLYPDQSQNNDAVVSLRLEYFREGIEDFQLLRQIAAIQSRKGQAGIRAQRLLSSIRAEIIRTGEVKTSLNPNHFRDEMLDIILAAHSP